MTAEPSPRAKKIGCLSILIFILVGTTCMTLLPDSCTEFEGESCKLMKKIDYDYSRVEELHTPDSLLKAASRQRWVEHAYFEISPHSEGIRLYCEDRDSFWDSQYGQALKDKLVN